MMKGYILQDIRIRYKNLNFFKFLYHIFCTPGIRLIVSCRICKILKQNKLLHVGGGIFLQDFIICIYNIGILYVLTISWNLVKDFVFPTEGLSSLTKMRKLGNAVQSTPMC